MKTNLTLGLGIVLLLMHLPPMAFSETPGQTGDEVSQLVKGLVISAYKSEKQEDTLVVRVENHTVKDIRLLPDALLHPNVRVSIDSLDGNSAQVFFVTHELPTYIEDIRSATQGKQIHALAPQKNLELSLKISDLLKLYDSATQKLIKAAAGRASISLSFDHLIVGIDGNKNPENAFQTTFEGPELALKK